MLPLFCIYTIKKAINLFIVYCWLLLFLNVAFIFCMDPYCIVLVLLLLHLFTLHLGVVSQYINPYLWGGVALFVVIISYLFLFFLFFLLLLLDFSCNTNYAPEFHWVCGIVIPKKQDN